MLDWFVGEGSTDQSLGGEDCIFGVGDGLSLGGGTDESFPFFGEGDDWGGGSGTLGVLDDFGGLSFH